MKVGSLPPTDLTDYLANGGLSIQTGPFRLGVRSTVPRFASAFGQLYADNRCELHPPFSDFHVGVEPVYGLRRWVRPQISFALDGQDQLLSVPRAQSLPLLEWGSNWCIANHSHSYLVLHAASLERGGRAVILPGPPGSGKSTLCAALVIEGWRLLSDELTLISLETGMLAALSRPLSLKNDSIDLIKARSPSAIFSESVANTAKGTVALMKAPSDSVERMHESAQPGWVVFPQFRKGAQTNLVEHAKEDTTIELARNAYNYSMYGRTGFEFLIALIEKIVCYKIVYDSLDEAVHQVSSLL